MSRVPILSYGGGQQSAAIAVLVVQGRLPRPERIVMADTGREASEVWRYLDAHMQPYLAAAGLKVEIAQHSLATVDLYAKSGEGRPLIPAFADGGSKRIPNFCSVEWKRRVVSRWLRAQGYGPKRPVVQWLGISTDEVQRANKDSGLEWASIEYPLLDLRLSRSDCITLVERAGLPSPPKSMCRMCAFRTNAEWLHMKKVDPQDFAGAIEIDREINARGLYLHRSSVPLDQVVFNEDKQGDLFDTCENGSCEF